MTAGRMRRLGAVALTVVCAPVLGLTATVSPLVGYQVERLGAQLLADEGWIMGGTGVPDPTAGGYINQILANFLQPSAPHFPGQPTFPGYDFQGLVTPEQFCPFVCLPGQPSLNFGQSLDAGVTALNQSILPQLLAGDNVTVFGYSQSALISSDLMARLADEGVSNDLVRFVLIGSPGTDEIPTDLYHTDVYNYEYDMVAFRPTYFNPLADLNSFMGFIYGHSVLLSVSPEQVASAVELPTTDPDSLNSYYMFPSE